MYVSCDQTLEEEAGGSHKGLKSLFVIFFSFVVPLTTLLTHFVYVCVKSCP